MSVAIGVTHGPALQTDPPGFFIYATLRPRCADIKTLKDVSDDYEVVIPVFASTLEFSGAEHLHPDDRDGIVKLLDFNPFEEKLFGYIAKNRYGGYMLHFDGHAFGVALDAGDDINDLLETTTYISQERVDHAIDQAIENGYFINHENTDRWAELIAMDMIENNVDFEAEDVDFVKPRVKNWLERAKR